MEKKTWSFFWKNNSSANNNDNNLNDLNVPNMVGGDGHVEPSELGDDFDDDEFLEYDHEPRRASTLQEPSSDRILSSRSNDRNPNRTTTSNETRQQPITAGRSPVPSFDSRKTSAGTFRLQSSEVDENIIRQSMEYYENQLVNSPQVFENIHSFHSSPYFRKIFMYRIETSRIIQEEHSQMPFRVISIKK